VAIAGMVLYTLSTETTTPNCQDCCRVREFLSVQGIEFQDRDIRASRAHRDELLERTGDLTVSRLECDSRVVVGFDSDALAQIVAHYQATTR
jgi:glutaredoxin